MKPVPAPGEPEGLILYDGVCVFCSRWVGWVIRRDTQARYRFLPIQSERGRVLAQRLGLNPEEPESNVVILGGQALFKSDAALAVVSSLDGWRWAGAGRAFSPPIRNWLYDRVARNRYRLFGRTAICHIPSPEMRERFLSGDVGTP